MAAPVDKFKELENLAQEKWASLADGDKAWIRVGTALCGMAVGASDVIGAIKEWLKTNGVDATVSRVGCLGLCFAEPLVDIKIPHQPRVVYRNVSPDDVPDLLDSQLVKQATLQRLVLGSVDGDIPGIARLADHPMVKDQVRVALRNAGVIDPGDIYQYIANGGYSGLRKAVIDMSPEEVIKAVQDSGLRGRGGAAFATGIKWSFLARSQNAKKYILCNCEEGDPGAFNDKGILESDPHTLIEGMILAGYATGADYGYVFIRHGHDGPIDRTRKAIEQAREHGFLGENILGSGFNFDAEVSLTGDSYVAGEETALMESIEGKRSMPRSRPPFPAQVGVFNHPSNINNIKTLAYVPEIVRKGGEWFSTIGTEKSKGTAIICLSGDLAYTGLVELPMGLTLEHVLHEVGGGPPNGKKLKFLQTGGPLGGVLSAENLDIMVDFDAMQQAGAILGSGGIIAADEDACVVDLTRSLVAFCQYESCGKCFPCRLGMTHILEIVERICNFETTQDDLSLMQDVGKNMQAGSLCGHGQLGFNPVSSALKYFREEFDEHIKEKRCPTGRCQTSYFSPTSTRR